jgi:hypothetical protein
MFSLSSLSITHIFILGVALHVVVVIALGMSPVLVGFSHTLPDGLLLLSRDGTTEARDLFKGRHFGLDASTGESIHPAPPAVLVQ